MREFTELELTAASRSSSALSILVSDVLTGARGHTDLVALVYAFAALLADRDADLLSETHRANSLQWDLDDAEHTIRRLESDITELHAALEYETTDGSD